MSDKKTIGELMDKVLDDSNKKTIWDHADKVLDDSNKKTVGERIDEALDNNDKKTVGEHIDEVNDDVADAARDHDIEKSVKKAVAVAPQIARPAHQQLWGQAEREIRKDELNKSKRARISDITSGKRDAKTLNRVRIAHPKIKGDKNHE